MSSPEIAIPRRPVVEILDPITVRFCVGSRLSSASRELSACGK